MPDLFSRQPDAPLAERLRPHSLEEVIGQQHLIGAGKPLRVAKKERTLLFQSAAFLGE